MTYLHLGKLRAWIRAACLATAGQATVQLLSFASGILIVRSLVPEQYAYYTIASTALGTMSVLSDGGITNSVIAQGGRVWQHSSRVGQVVATGMMLRLRFAVVAVLITVPLMIGLLLHHGSSVLGAIVVAAATLPLFLALVSSQLLETVPRLYQQLFPLQRIQIAANLGRVAVLALTMPLLPFAAVASLAAALPQWWNNLRLRQLASRFSDWRVPADPEIHTAILAQVARTMPAAAYYAFSGQLTIWLISIFGKTTSVATVGALSRLAMLLAVLGTAFAVLAVPRFARLSSAEAALLRRRYWQSQGLLILLCAVVVIAVASYPGSFLNILGANYLQFRHEAALMALSSAIAVMAGAAFNLGAARAIVLPPLLAIPFGLTVQIGLIAILPLDSVAGVIWLGLLSESILWLLQVSYFSWATRADSSAR